LKNIAYQGEAGAYSEAAAIKYFGDDNTLLPQFNFEGIFESVSSGAAGYGVVPIENSLFGSVMENYDLLNRYSLHITGELSLEINHFLMAVRQYRPEELKKIYSHPQALGQCSEFLKSLPGVKIIPSYDTAGSAKMIAETGEEYAAAIAGKNAAGHYGLKIIKSRIQNDLKNYTRFLIVENRENTPQGENCKTSLCFELKSVPGSLFKALGAFAFRDINLTKIESRPIPAKTFQYLFYIDVAGNVNNEKLVNAIANLREISENVKILGCYESGKVFKS
jgi:prephenate dehydratase